MLESFLATLSYSRLLKISSARRLLRSYSYIRSSVILRSSYSFIFSLSLFFLRMYYSAASFLYLSILSFSSLMRCFYISNFYLRSFISLSRLSIFCFYSSMYDWTSDISVVRWTLRAAFCGADGYSFELWGLILFTIIGSSLSMLSCDYQSLRLMFARNYWISYR